MIQLIVKFAGFCRVGGLQVSTSEVLDTAAQLQLINVFDENQFKAVTMTNFAKSHRDQNLFIDLYNIFFHQTPPASISKSKPKDSAAQDGMMNMLQQMTQNDEKNKPITDFLLGDPNDLVGKIQAINTQNAPAKQIVKSNLGVLSDKLDLMLRINKIRSKITQFFDQQGHEMAQSERESLAQYLDHRLNTASQMLTKEPQPLNENLIQVKSNKKHLSQLGEKFLSSLTAAEVEEMRDILTHLIRKLKDVASRRYAAKSRGVLDVKKTLRIATKHQGIPLEVKFKNKSPSKPKIVILCDISGSVWSAARFMLNLLYSLQDCFSKVRSFIFVAECLEVTSIFEKFEINEAIENIMNNTELNYLSPTDYGETLVKFKSKYLDILNKKTTFIIVGDGRSNYLNPQERILGEIRERARRIIWLNPEPEQFWTTGDSVMNTYKAYCHEVRPCQNMNQLMDFIEELVL